MKEDSKGWMYILLCADGSYYTGSTNNLERRILQHQLGKGSNHTKTDSPLSLSIMKNINVLILLFTERNRYRDGVGRKKKH